MTDADVERTTDILLKLEMDPQIQQVLRVLADNPYSHNQQMLVLAMAYCKGHIDRSLELLREQGATIPTKH